MFDSLGLPKSLEILVHLMLSFAFFVGILLMVSEEAFYHFNKALQREYGIRRRMISNLEENANNIVDWLIIKYRLISGLLIAVSSFILLLIYK